VGLRVVGLQVAALGVGALHEYWVL
jgi:hypothetical protein